MLLRRAEAHHRFDAGAVVPGAVEGHELAGGREVRDVALEIPLAAFGLGRLGQRDVARRGAGSDIRAASSIVPPLPAASRPSNTISTRSPVDCSQCCSFTSSICSVSSVPRIRPRPFCRRRDSRRRSARSSVDPVRQFGIVDVESRALSANLDVDRLPLPRLAAGLPKVFHAPAMALSPFFMLACYWVARTRAKRQTVGARFTGLLSDDGRPR